MSDKREYARDIYNACKTHGEIVDKIQEALESRDTIAALRSQLATVTAEREAMREAIGNLFIIIGNHTGDEIKCDRITEKMWIAEAYALKGGKG